MKTITTAKESFHPLSSLYSAFRPLEFIEAYTQKYGDIYRVKVGQNPSVVTVSNPQAIEEIFTSGNTFRSAEANKIFSFLLGDNSILLLDGRRHKNRRRLLMPPFHGESIYKYSQEIIAITNRVCDRLEVKQSFKVRPLMQEITLSVILNLVFGINSGTRYERLEKLLVELLSTFNTPAKSLLLIFPLLQQDWGRFSPWGRFLHLKAEIKQLIYSEIKTKRASIAKGESHQDVLSMLLLAKDENGNAMKDNELHDELITLLFAGHETTASALSWLFYWVHYLPKVQQKLRWELNSLEEYKNYQTIDNLHYLNAVISETLRIYPVTAGTFARIPNKPSSILGYKLESNDWLSISIFALHHRQDLYPSPRQFMPERFLERTYSPYEYIPFGGGNRRCIGSALALLEMKLVAVTILSRFQFALNSDLPMYPVLRGITLAPPASFKMTVEQELLNNSID